MVRTGILSSFRQYAATVFRSSRLYSAVFPAAEFIRYGGFIASLNRFRSSAKIIRMDSSRNLTSLSKTCTGCTRLRMFRISSGKSGFRQNPYSQHGSPFSGLTQTRAIEYLTECQAWTDSFSDVVHSRLAFVATISGRVRTYSRNPGSELAKVEFRSRFRLGSESGSMPDSLQYLRALRIQDTFENVGNTRKSPLFSVIRSHNPYNREFPLV